MRGLINEEMYPSALNIDYGQPMPPIDQYWICRPGEELFVAQPTATLKSMDYLRSVISGKAFKLKDSTPSSTPLPGDGDNPLCRLPYDIIHRIVYFLPTKDVVNFTMASSYARGLLLANRTLWWSRMADDMPWFYELPGIVKEVEETRGEKVDLRRVWVWTQEVSRPVQFIRGPFMGLANRRRIWTPCSVLADLYRAKVPDDWDGVSEQSEEPDETDWEDEEDEEEDGDEDGNIPDSGEGEQESLDGERQNNRHEALATS